MGMNIYPICEASLSHHTLYMGHLVPAYTMYHVFPCWKKRKMANIKAHHRTDFEADRNDQNRSAPLCNQTRIRSSRSFERNVQPLGITGLQNYRILIQIQPVVKLVMGSNYHEKTIQPQKVSLQNKTQQNMPKCFL